MAESRSKLPLLVFFASLALGLAGGSWFFFRAKPDAPVSPPPARPVPEAPAVESQGAPASGETARESRPMTGSASSAPPASQGEWLARFGEALETGDFERIATLTGDPALAARLREFAGGKPLKLRQPAAREVGELELNALTRWALELEEAAPGRERILLDLRRKDGRWSLERLILPTAGEAASADSLAIADAFLRALLRQDFETAKSHATATVSDATLAGLCILFEEGDYHLRKQKPLRVMLQRPDATGYLVNVETSDSSLAAQFSLLLKPTRDGADWRVAEVNLDQLLADFAKRYAGGDTYYTPLIRNPKGGDTLVLYFEFDQDQLAPRTRRQLEIVSLILRGDAGKKLTLSGHTDALGATGYNEGLSLRRAEIVRDFLVESGVAREQITTVAKGMSQPRRPNFTEAGSDNPEGRRANRRTEIYLDF